MSNFFCVRQRNIISELKILLGLGQFSKKKLRYHGADFWQLVEVDDGNTTKRTAVQVIAAVQHEEPTNHRSKNPLYFQGKSLPTAAKLQR